MAKTSQEIEQEFVTGLQSSTGADLDGWMAAIKKSGIEKRNDIINWLKEEQQFGHMNASLLMGIYANGGKPVYANEDILLDSQFEKCADMRPLFEALKQAILDWDKEARFVAKKTYVSVTKKREFSAVNIKKGELRVGLDLGDRPFNDRVEKAKLTGPMPRISHMVVIRNTDDFNEEFFELLTESDKRVNA